VTCLEQAGTEVEEAEICREPDVRVKETEGREEGAHQACDCLVRSCNDTLNCSRWDVLS
jgi:hypothetical protein